MHTVTHKQDNKPEKHAFAGMRVWMQTDTDRFRNQYTCNETYKDDMTQTNKEKGQAIIY